MYKGLGETYRNASWKEKAYSLIQSSQSKDDFLQKYTTGRLGYEKTDSKCWIHSKTDQRH